MRCVTRAERMRQSCRAVSACCAISCTTHSMNTRSLALTCRLGDQTIGQQAHAQARLACENLNAILAAAGSAFADVVDVTVFMIDPVRNQGHCAGARGLSYLRAASTNAARSRLKRSASSRNGAWPEFA